MASMLYVPDDDEGHNPTYVHNGNPLPVKVPTGEAVTVGGMAFVVRASQSRPADSSGYIAYDAISDSTSAPHPWLFTVARAGVGSGILTHALLSTDHAAGVARIELDLYDDVIAATNDNAEATRTPAGLAKFLFTLTFGALAKPTTNSTLAQATLANINLPFACAPGGTGLYGRLRTLDAFTPASAAVYYVTLIGVRD